MKKIVSILLLLCTVVTLCISFTSCDTETVTPYTRLRDHLNSELKPGQSMQMKNPTAKVVVDIWPNVSEGEDESIRVRTTIPMEAGYKGYIEFQLYNGSTEYKIDYVIYETKNNKIEHSATIEMKAADYTGNEILPFASVNKIPVADEYNRRMDVTAVFNATLWTLDGYLHKIHLSVADFGFVNLSNKYLASDTDINTAEENLGGIFSAERFAYAGQMLLLGIGMVFLVLAILWMVLIIFAKTMGGAEKKSAKADKPVKAEPKPAPKVAPAPVAAPAPATSDDAIVAAITAAIAMTIESDPALSSQFAGGFRVVSFKKKSGKTSWNH